MPEFPQFLQDFWNEKKNENFKFSKSPFPLLDNLINSFLQILFSNWEAGTYLTQIHLFVTVKHSFAEKGTLGQYFFSKLLLKYLFIQHNDFMILHQEINSYLLGPCEQCLDIGETFTFFFFAFFDPVIKSCHPLCRQSEKANRVFSCSSKCHLLINVSLIRKPKWVSLGSTSSHMV